jgi:quercetin dioxygenase-like cupin family protein
MQVTRMSAPAQLVRTDAVSDDAARRLSWHSHRGGRTVYVAEGAWLVQRRGQPVEVVGSGQRAYFAPGEEHWHLAAPTADVAHLAALLTTESVGAEACPDQAA